MSVSLQGTREVTMLEGMIGDDSLEEWGLLLQTRVCVEVRVSRGYLLVLLCRIISVKGNCIKNDLIRLTTQGWNPSGMKVPVIMAGKQFNQTEMFVSEVRKNLEWVLRKWWLTSVCAALRLAAAAKAVAWFANLFYAFERIVHGHHLKELDLYFSFWEK